MKFTRLLICFLFFPAVSFARDHREARPQIREPSEKVESPSATASQQVLIESSQKLISFGDLPKLVKEKNENIKAARVNVEAQEKRTGHFTRSFLPQVSANLGQEDFRADTIPARNQSYWRLNASVNLYRGGKDRFDEDIRETTVSIAEVDYSREYNQELQRAKKAFWGVVAVEKLIADRKEELKKNDENIKSARRRAGAGVTTTADAVQFELHKTLLIQNIKKLELEKDLNRNRLSVALGLDEHENIFIKDDFPRPSEQSDKINPLKVEEQLEIQSLRSKEKIDELRSDQSRRWWHPRVDLYASYGMPSLSDDLDRALAKEKEVVTGVLLSIDLGQGLNDSKESQAKKLEAKSASFRVAQKTREFVAVDHELRHDIRLLSELIVDVDKDVEKAAQFLKLTENEYTRGVKNGPDLLSAFQKFYEFRERRIGLYRNYFEAQAELESLLAKAEVL